MRAVDVNGLHIAYERVGQGPPLILVHGAADDSRSWRPQVDGLSDEFTVVAWDEPGAGRSSDLPEGFTLADYAHCLAGLIETLELAATLIMIDTYAGWKGSLPAEEVTARVAGARQMLDAPPGQFDPTFPGRFAGEPPAQFVPILAAIAGDVRPATLRHQLSLMAEADHRDLLPRIAVPTLLLWGEHDVRSPLGSRTSSTRRSRTRNSS